MKFLLFLALILVAAKSAQGQCQLCGDPEADEQNKDKKVIGEKTCAQLNAELMMTETDSCQDLFKEKLPSDVDVGAICCQLLPVPSSGINLHSISSLATALIVGLAFAN